MSDGCLLRELPFQLQPDLHLVPRPPGRSAGNTNMGNYHLPLAVCLLPPGVFTCLFLFVPRHSPKVGGISPILQIKKRMPREEKGWFQTQAFWSQGPCCRSSVPAVGGAMQEPSEAAVLVL